MNNFFKKIMEVMLSFLLIIGGLFVGMYGFMIFISLLLTPVITVYNSAATIYMYNNDSSVWQSAANFASGYVRAWALLLSGLFIILFVKLIKKRIRV